MEHLSGSKGSVWLIEPRYTTVQFIAKFGFLREVKGRLPDVTGFIVRNDEDLHGSSVEAVIRTGTLDTGNHRRDKHLQSKNFLASDEYSELRYVSSNVVKGRDRDTLRVTGMLTLHGKSREVILEVTEVERSLSPQGDEVAYYSAQAEINRHDFGVSALRFVIGRKVKVVIHVQAVRQ
ncbi:MAG: YceI family protein [Acidobacteriota bacterium]